MNKNSNTYTLVYASVMVVIVAFLLAILSQVLKPMQDANEKNDTQSQILTALNYDKNNIDVEKTFKEVVTDSLWDAKTHSLKAYNDPFENKYSKAVSEGRLHVFTANTKDGKKYVIPVTGRGLWGGLWGYVALNEDCNTVYGVYFSHESETAGLGALISESAFQQQFKGHKVFAPADSTYSNVALTVVKNGKVDDKTVQVDGVTGATLTSNGVAAMLQDGLAPYVEFFNKVRK